MQFLKHDSELTVTFREVLQVIITQKFTNVYNILY